MTTITAKIDDSDKIQYQQMCKEKDTTISQEFRKFIKNEIKKYKEENKK